MFKLLDRVNGIMSFFGGILILFMVLSITYSVATRAFHLDSPLWINQFNDYSLVWVCFLTTAWLLANDKHVRVDIVFSRLSQRGKRVILFIQNIVGAALCALMCYQGILSTWEHIRDKVMDVQSIDVPKGWVLWVIPLGFFLLTLVFLRKAIENAQTLKSGEVPASPVSVSGNHPGEVEG